MKFYLPDFVGEIHLNMFMITLLSDHPEYFYPKVEIGGVYGSLPGAIWNGGRLTIGFLPRTEARQMVEAYNNLGVPVRYTFTNHLIEEKHLNDGYCNMMMDVANNGLNEVIINSPVLEDYLRNKYPNFKYILSTTRCERDLDKINEATKKYDLVVTDYRDNANLTFLQNIQDKSKIELLINAYCDPKCACRKRHYDCIARHQINYEPMNPDTDKQFLECPTYQRDFFDILEFPTVLTQKDVYGRYSKMGFEHFKIEGRTMPLPQVIESYLYYLIKPEYRDKVRLEILKNCVG
jgi:collagenase-like PrtC family protease